MIILRCSCYIENDRGCRGYLVVEPYQFEPILTESDCESDDGGSTDGDIDGYDVNEDQISQVGCWVFVYSLHCKEGILEF